MALATRKLSDKAFQKYARKKYDNDPLPDADAFDCWDADKLTLVLRGFDKDAKAVLRAANGGHDAAAELEVPWCAMDRVSYIMRRIEEIIRVPVAHWVLASEEGALKADTVACNSLAFLHTSPELILVPKTALEVYKQSLRPSSQDSVQKAKTLFSLIEPLASDTARQWAAYLRWRKKHITQLQKTMSGLDDEDEATRAMLEQIRRGTVGIIASSGLSDEQLASAETAIVPGRLTLEDDDGDLRSAKVSTRIYSLRQPGAVDVDLEFYQKAGYHSVDWSVEVHYCLKERLPNDEIDISVLRTLISCGLEDTNETGRADRWNPREDKKFEMSGSDVRAVQRVLFGDANFSLVDTVRLMLSAVGMHVNLRVENEGDEKQTEEKIKYDTKNGDAFKWFQSTTKYSLFDARWLGVQIRRACDAAIPSDADYVDRAAEPRYSRSDFGDDSDEDSEEWY
ncbi:hypothetical protein AURDEDRAFT_172688 [Auricularia subglabra TFB-10046 SS5]|nr:hypothetical protein AURDEDRAFT_172688 [Auricularia subglabra TFB-10046 SS5]